MTPNKYRLLDRLFERGGFVRGAEVRMAKDMPDFVTLEDNGYMPGNSERWFATLTPAGKDAVKSRCFSCSVKPRKYVTGLCEGCHQAAVGCTARP